MVYVNSGQIPRTLERRLSEAREGVVSEPVARVVVFDFARLPLEVFCQGHPREARELSYLVDLPELEEGDPAIEHGWDVDRRCLSAAAWRLERVFRDRDDPGRSPGVRAKLRKIAERLSEDLSEVLWGFSGSKRFDGIGCDGWAARIGSDFVYGSARLNCELARIDGTPEQVRAIYGFCGLRVSQIRSVCLDFVPGAAEEASKGLPRAPERLAQMQVLPLIRMVGESPDLDDLVRPVLVAPLAMLWEAGVLSGLSRDVKESRRVTELERRLSAA